MKDLFTVMFFIVTLVLVVVYGCGRGASLWSKLTWDFVGGWECIFGMVNSRVLLRSWEERVAFCSGGLVFSGVFCGFMYGGSGNVV